MLPTNSKILLEKTNSQNSATKTYKIANGKVSGFIDEKEALIQSIETCLRTKRHSFAIYSYDYGHELDKLMTYNVEIVKARVKTRLEEALLTDERIVSIENVEASVIDRNLYLCFNIKTIYGDEYYEGVI